MTWTTPTIETLRQQGRDYVTAATGVGAVIPNSPMRVITDANSGMASLVMQYIDWLSRQLLPDTAESEWLVRQANIWLKRGRKQATYSSGEAAFTGTVGFPVPAGTPLTAGNILFETAEGITLGTGPTNAPIVAQVGGASGNLDPGSTLSLAEAIPGVTGTATVVSLAGGVDAESDDELRIRVLDRIQQPPMGGDANDYVAWAMSVPGVTRAWCAPNEQGVGTVTLRFMMDDLRATTDGFPLDEDIATVQAYLDTVRPVTVRDLFIFGPVVTSIDVPIQNLYPDTTAIRAAIEANLKAMITDRAAPAYSLNGVAQPAQTIYAAWISDAILNAPGVESFDLDMPDQVMPGPGYMALLGTVTYV
ncbi:hypothetical protein LMIY3S_03704 [Labrys miyagiensis]